jgi:hypothetical protein
MGVANSAWWVAGLLDTPAVFSRISVEVRVDELPTVATTYVVPVAAIVAGAK